MDLRLEQLDDHLAQNQLLPVYIVHGNEPLLHQEALDKIRQSAAAQGYTERKQFHVDQYFDWDTLTVESQSMSLFAEHKIIELRMPKGKPGSTGSKALLEYCNHIPEDQLLIVAIETLEAPSKSSKWFKALTQKGANITIWQINGQNLERWIRQRCQQSQLTIENEALTILCQHIEGNLLAAHQALEKIKLERDARAQETLHITMDMIQQRISDSARFNVYQLVDKALQGSAQEARRILQSLKLEGSSTLAIIAPLTAEVQRLLLLSNKQKSGEHLDDKTLMQNGIWKSRQPVVLGAIKRLSYNQLQIIHRQVKHLDNAAKGLLKMDVWLEIDILICMLVGMQLHDKTTQKLCLQRYYQR